MDSSNNIRASSNSKKELKIELTLYTILQILSVSIFEKVPILQALSGYDYKNTTSDPQMSLF